MPVRQSLSAHQGARPRQIQSAVTLAKRVDLDFVLIGGGDYLLNFSAGIGIAVSSGARYGSKNLVVFSVTLGTP